MKFFGKFLKTMMKKKITKTHIYMGISVICSGNY